MLYNQKKADLYTRAYNVTIENPLDGVPFVRFNEELIELTEFGTRGVGRAGHHVAVSFHPELAETEFTVYHPVTGEEVATSTYGNLQAMVYSLYLHLAAIRDADELQLAEGEPSPPSPDAPVDPVEEGPLPLPEEEV